MGDELDTAWVDVTGTGSHNKTFQWSQSHGSIDGFAAVHCGKRGTVAQVADDNFQIFRFLAEDLSGTQRNVSVGCTVETVAAHAVFFIIFIRKTIDVCFRRHGLMKSGIKYTNHRSIRH